MPVINRQPDLLRQLRSPEGRSLRQLCAVLGVSKNTVQRDLDQLSNAAFPITEEHQGQRLLYRLEASAQPAQQPAPMTATELAPLLTALWPWRKTSWFKQLKARLAPQEVGETMLDASAPEPMVSGGGATLSHLVRGLLEHKLVRVSYLRREQATQYRVTLEPARLRAAGGLLYLDAHVVPGGELRTFAVHLIKDARVSKRGFTPRALAARSAFGATEGAPVEVVVKFAAPVAEFIRERRWHPSQQLEEVKDGLVWRGVVSGEHEFIGWVMSWSPWAELLSPPAWRRRLHERALTLVSKHGDAHLTPSRSSRAG